MTEILFWVTYGTLWLLVATLVVATFFLYMQHGRMLLDSREGRATQGPPLGEPFPDLPLRDLTRVTTRLSQPGTRALLVFFASPTCKPCQEARAALGTFANQQREAIETAVICAGSEREAREFAADLPSAIRVIPDPDRRLTTHLRVASTPYALLADRERVMVARGMPVTPEAFDWFTEQLTNAEQERVSTAAPVAPLPVRA